MITGKVNHELDQTCDNDCENLANFRIDMGTGMAFNICKVRAKKLFGVLKLLVEFS